MDLQTRAGQWDRAQSPLHTWDQYLVSFFGAHRRGVVEDLPSPALRKSHLPSFHNHARKLKGHFLQDFYGRGLSDGTTAKHDEKLYIAQAMAVLEANEWTEDITVVGYSMGGSIAVHLNNEQPDLIKHLILLAPAGMIRLMTFGIPKWILWRSIKWASSEGGTRHGLIDKNLQAGIQ
ncbi:alpha/beta hydrolase, partial [Candidatus Bathyarchaeota archaeon]|nr:alpha/beta hydrolase [Candidatus Bathyarchaeota archaeon]